MSNNRNSFSMDVKEEILKNIPQARHCKIAEIAVIIACNGKVKNDSLVVGSDNERIIQKYFTLLKKTFNINADALENKGFFEVTLKNPDEVAEVLQAVKILDARKIPQKCDGLIADVLLKNSCCKKSFIKMVFLLSGSMSDPKKGAHLEFVLDRESHAVQVIECLEELELKAKLIIRKNKYVVYMKDSNNVGDFLRLMEAPIATMEYENLMILREIANTANRRNNCDVANISRAVAAADKQIDDINFLNNHVGLSNLPDALRVVAEARIENPEVGLKELGELMRPPLGKSGVNHRLRKLSEMARRIRENNDSLGGKDDSERD